jgi:hypothetical protein
MSNPVFIRNLPDGAIAVSAGSLFGDRRRASRPLPQSQSQSLSLSARRERTLLELAKLGLTQRNNQQHTSK